MRKMFLAMAAACVAMLFLGGTAREAEACRWFPGKRMIRVAAKVQPVRRTMRVAKWVVRARPGIVVPKRGGCN